MSWKVTLRAGSRVRRTHFDSLDAAIEAAESHAREVAKTAPRGTIDLKVREFEPIQQVAGRIELAGPERLFPSARGGVDVRGDGSTEAYVGRLRREVVKQRGGETPYAALRRALAKQQR